MKVIAFNRFPEDWNPALSALMQGRDMPGSAPLDSTLLTDSATLRSHEPMFVPDFARQWVVEVAPAVIVSRLGKWIEPRFAGRYFSRMMMVGRLLPPDESAPSSALETNFDGALARGIEMDADALAPGGEGLEISVNGGEPMRITPGQLHLEELIGLASRYMMLKTGDMIIPCRTRLRVPAVPDTRLRVAVNSAEALNLKIK